MNYLQCSLPSCQHELKIFFWFQNCAKIKWKIDLQTTGFKKITMMGLLMKNVLSRVLFLLMGEGKPPFKGNLRYKYAPLCSLGPYIS